MTARHKKTVVRRTAGGRTKATLCLALLAVATACTSYTEIPIETPIQPKLDVSAFQRIFIAGFIAGANEDVDANMETVRLLRSQLRNKGIMRVIDADTLPLLEIAKQNSGDANTPPVPDQQAVTPAQDQDKPTVINDEKDLERYQHIFANVAYWKKIGEEYQQPLIVTGAVLFTPSQAFRFRAARAGNLRSLRPARRRPGPHLHGAQGIHPAPDFYLHRRPHRRDSA